EAPCRQTGPAAVSAAALVVQAGSGSRRAASASAADASKDRRFIGRSPQEKFVSETGSKQSPLGGGIDAACTILPVRRKPVGARRKAQGIGSKRTCRPALWHDFVTVLPCR